MPLVLVGDIGSTSGNWALLEGNGQVRTFVTTGYNPALHNDLVRNKMLDQLGEILIHADRIFYYGTGVIDPSQSSVLADDLRSRLSAGDVIMNTDLLGAARATCQRTQGIVGILGTGSNCGLYNGHTITKQCKTLGYPLGDEGSGWYIGARLVREYYYGNMPESLSVEFADLVPDTKMELLNYLRTSPFPNRYLASFTTFAAGKPEDPWLRAIVRECLLKYTSVHLSTLGQKMPVHMVGSVAFGFRQILLEVLTEQGFEPGVIVKDPLNGLIQYHQQEI